MPVYVRFECGREDRISKEYGPYDFIQITYTALRDPDGEDIALLQVDQDWAPVDEMNNKFGYYSDIVIFNSESNITILDSE